MKERDNYPLVTIIVSTYNSSRFILETLDSFVAQTYPNIELIIGDDASSDDTLIKVRNWLSSNNNKNKFWDVKIIEVEVNTGVSANANRSLHKATGDWIKFIGADDVLLPNCIRDNMEFVKNNKNVRVLFSKVNKYNETFDPEKFIITAPGIINQNSIVGPNQTAEKQHQMLLRNDSIHFTPSVFLHRETLLSVNGFDERFRLLEDYPLWLNLTKKGHKLYFMDKVTVNYRTHAHAINNTGKQHIVNPNYFKQERFRQIYTYPYLPTAERLNQRYVWYMSQLFRLQWFNKVNGFNNLVYSIFTFYTNPFRYYLKIKKIIKSN